MEHIKILVSDNIEDTIQVNENKVWYAYQPGLTVEDLFKGLIKQSYREIGEVISIVLKNWKSYLIIVDGMNIIHREGLQTQIKNGSDIVVFIKLPTGG